MIAARQLGFLGKVVRGPHDAPACRMLTACCQHKCKRGRPYLHNKDVIVQNLRLLFAQIPKVVINDYGSVKDWFKEASHESYWTALVRCLLDKQAPLPTQPTEWPPQGDAVLADTRPPLLHKMTLIPPTMMKMVVRMTVLSRRQSHPPHVNALQPPPPSPCRSQPRTDYDPEMVGRSLEHSFKALGLGLGATETEVKVKYRALA
jgi:hypothetical protein